MNIYGRLNNKASSRLIKGLSKNVNSSVKRAIRLGMYICSLIFIIIAFYQIEDVNSSSLNGEFIAKGYKKSLVTIDNQRYTVISMSGVPLTEDALSIIALSPADTTVFYRSDNGIINLSFLLKNKSISFTYQENNFIKAKCIIREALSGGSRICER